MRMSFKTVRTMLALACSSLLTAGLAQAKMEAMADSELSDVTGQAFINLTTDSASGIDYTRVNFGTRIETSLNLKKLQLGGYERAGEATGTSDILINNFALGSVDDATGQINPFLINNPYLELAYQDKKVIGVRIGFGEAKGILSGDIERLTGNVPVHLQGTADPIFDRATFFEKSLLTIAGLTRNSIMEADAQLVTGFDVADPGAVDPVRATHAGLTDGTALTCRDGCNLGGLTTSLLSLFSSKDCKILGLDTCFALSQFRSLPVGDLSKANTYVNGQLQGASKGFFIGLQQQDMTWKGANPGELITALKGAMLNMSKVNGVAPVNIDFEQGFGGIPRVDTCLGTAAC